LTLKDSFDGAHNGKGDSLIYYIRASTFDLEGYKFPH
jgi:hypothetical protein